MLLKTSLYILRMQYMSSQSTLEFLFVKPLFLSFKLSFYWWIFKVGSKLFVLKISIAWKKLIQWLTVDELYICNDISLHIWKKRCLNFRQTLKTKGNRKCRNEDSEIDDKCPKRMKIKGPDFFVGYSNVLNSVFVWELWQCILGVNHLMIEDIVYVE